MSGVSVREARALAIGIAAAHGVERFRKLGRCEYSECNMDELCKPCVAWDSAIEAVLASVGGDAIVRSPMQVATVALFDELRREADEQAARGG